MAAVLRVKRKRTDDALSALVLSYKKSRATEYDSHSPDNSESKKEGTPETMEETQKEVFRLYASTEPNEVNAGFLRKILRAVRPGNYKEGSKNAMHLANLNSFGLAKNRPDDRSSSENFVEEFRSISCDDLESDETLTQVNARLEPSCASSLKSGIVCNGQEMIRLKTSPMEVEIVESAPSEYVYDFYCSSGIPEDEFRKLENWLGVEPWMEESPLIIDKGRDSEESDENQDDDDDSNDESNWRNDYPDEEEYGGDETDGSQSSEGLIDPEIIDEMDRMMRGREDSDSE